jgi:alpha-galactosidase
MYVEPTKEKAVVFVYRMLFTRKMHQKIIKFQGLDPERKYLIKEVAPEVEGQPIELDGKIVSGRYLMEEGVVIKELTTESSRRTPYNDIRDTNDYRSCILELIAQ